MKTTFFLAGFLALAGPLFAQSEKGAHPVTQSTNQPVNQTRAVVVGISDYQNPQIPDLRFADRDAAAFAEWLRSPAGGSVPESHLQVLLNSDATAGKIIAALGGLVTDCKPGDQAVIYFSGHGDVERISKYQRGFWLSWDAPPAVYAAGGTCALGYLQDIVSTLSDVGVQVVVVADADSSVQILYRAFSAALKRGDLLEARDGVSPSADTLYRQLIREPALADLHGLMTRNFAAALMDEGQQVLNRFLSGDLQAFEILENAININPRLLADQFYRAAELLGEKHYYYKNTKAKGLYFETYTLDQQDISYDSARMLDYQLLQQAVSIDSMAVHVWLNLHWLDSSLVNKAYYEERLENLVPNWKLFHYIVGATYAEILPDDPEKSLAYFRRTLELDSTFAPAWYYSQFPLRALGRKEEADQSRENAIRIGLKKMETSPHLMSGEEWLVLSKDFLELEKMEEVVRIGKAYLAVDSFSVFRLNSYAQNMQRFKLYAEAEYAHQKIMALDSNNVWAWTNYGWLNFEQRRYAEAERAFRKSVVLAPKNDYGWTGLGWSLLNQQRLEEVEKAFLRSLELNKRLVGAWNGLGVLYRQQKRYPEAIHARKRYTELWPKVAYGWSTLGQVLSEAGNYPEAEAAYRKAIQLDSTNIGTYNSLTLALYRAGKYAEMTAVCRQAIALDSTNATVWSNLGLALLQTGQHAEAETALQRAISLNPKSANAHKHLATLHFRTGRLDEARAGYEKAVELNPDYSGGYLGRAYLLAAEKKTADALVQVELAIQKNATFEQLEQDTDLAPLRALPEWRALMKKHFPDKEKD